MNEQHKELNNDREQLLQRKDTCEKLLSDCTLDKFSELRYELKQVKEKLRLLNQLTRLR
ncbi:hypothetical protein [Segetibacter sp.]|jgi:hypothetical protein|uniref:hypothetical protein n=1 Tax=Segetibacter sp. TaxID=2231182 RepID=UPI00261CAA21|nr:hypothetical protein [Segetibacter sp.]MCW3078849.1 hypothetical protein [Segetibacter sp.]